MKFSNISLEKAAVAAVEELRRDGGIGGVIAIDNEGNGAYTPSIVQPCRTKVADFSHHAVSMPLNCPGMYRGVIRDDGIPKTAIFNDDIVA